ncbi:NAD(P)-binding domain protein [Akanthomyces lecanii RCEF 1005]|uniref:NAD(P)-binding domain protein n=1 Tax=Akanthomyces lecanii RCEF 1005 TaxID=1081108 RepID=A0A162LDX6_CORDF|nr:NAD(P)-binding domain protein [Akanthomyces lecanii RCEF 1005]
MVSLSVVQRSNSLISNSLSSPVTALFVGGTSGVGRTTLLKLAKFAKCPRIYLVGRSQAAADEIITECRTLNPQGHYTFVQADVSLVAGVDRFCETFKGLESTLDLLFLSPGVLSMDRSVTSENIHLLAAVNYYCRMRIITSLLPLVQRSSLRRVVTVAGGGNEGPLDLDDLQGLRVPIPQLRGHLSTLITLGLEAVAIKAPSVSFIHSYPGSVVTGLYRDLEKPPFDLASAVSIGECGERQLYVATNARLESRA